MKSQISLACGSYVGFTSKIDFVGVEGEQGEEREYVRAISEKKSGIFVRVQEIIAPFYRKKYAQQSIRIQLQNKKLDK